MSSREIVEWEAFFELQEEELNRRERKARNAAKQPERAPAIGDAGARGDAITEARKAQGLE